MAILLIQVLSIFEELDTGEVLCTSCPNDKLIITAGSNAVCILTSFPKGYFDSQILFFP